MTHTLLLGLMATGLVAAACSGFALYFVPQWITNRRPHHPETPARVHRWQSWSFVALLAGAALVLTSALLTNPLRRPPAPIAIGTSTEDGETAAEAPPSRTPEDDDPTLTDMTPAAPTSGSHPARPTAPAPPGSPALSPQLNANIESVLQAWAAAMQSNNPEREAAFYAGRLDRYFLYNGVSKRAVLQDKQQFVRSGKRLVRFQLADIALQPVSPTDVKVRCVKQWQLAPPDAGHANPSRLELRKIDGAWKITTEQDLK